MAKYYYKDSAGTQHCTTTETGRLKIENGTALREQILDSGDYTGQLRDTDDGPYWGKTLSIGALGASRI
jgi:hypothetical protein